MVECVNFRVIENYNYEDNFESFKKDLLNGVTKRALQKKYNISSKIYNTWRWKVIDNLNFDEKDYTSSDDDYFLRKSNRGYISLIRWDGDEKVSYGTFPDEETAEHVASVLMKFGWDELVAFKLLNLYGVENSKKFMSIKILQRKK